MLVLFEGFVPWQLVGSSECVYFSVYLEYIKRIKPRSFPDPAAQFRSLVVVFVPFLKAIIRPKNKTPFLQNIEALRRA